MAGRRTHETDSGWVGADPDDDLDARLAPLPHRLEPEQLAEREPMPHRQVESADERLEPRLEQIPFDHHAAEWVRAVEHPDLAARLPGRLRRPAARCLPCPT